MHIHTTHASAAGNALAGAQAAETSMALRRARELREAASKIAAGATEVDSDTASDAETVAMIGAWPGAKEGRDPSQNQGSSAARHSDGLEDLDESETPTHALQTRAIKRAPEGRPVSFWA